MSRSIKVSETVYQRLLETARPRETFSQEVARLLDIQLGIASLTSTLEGAREFAEFQAKKLREVAPAIAP